MNGLKSHAEQVDMFRSANAAADIVEYGEMPDYKTNDIGWTSRMRARMATSKDMRRTGLGKKDMNFNVILNDVITHLTEQGCMGDEKAAWRQLHSDVKAYIHNRRRSRDENKRYVEERQRVVEYGKSLGMTDSEISAGMVGTSRGLNYEGRCRDHFDYYVKMHPREAAPAVAAQHAPDPDKLDDWFGPKENRNVTEVNEMLTGVSNAQAEQDKPAVNDWITDGGKRKRFWGTINDLRDTYEITDEGRDEIIAEIAGGKLHDYPGTANVIIKAFKEACEKISGKHETKKIDEKATSSPAAQSTGVTQPTSQEKPPAQEIASSEPPIAIPATTLMIVDRPIDPTTVDSETGEIIEFDPNRAIAAVQGAIALVNRMFTAAILVPEVDYGRIPGNDKAKPTLLKPGAEKLLTAFQFYSKCIPTSNSVSDWKNGFFNFEYECIVYNRANGRIEGSGIGSCNSMESKYRYRWIWDNEAKAQGLDLKSMTTKTFEGKNGKQYTKYRVENEDIFDQVNTLSKMAQKRALVAATLNATGASAVFTQDQEDFQEFGLIEKAS